MGWIFGLDIRVLDDFRPFDDLGLDIGINRLRRSAAGAARAARYFSGRSFGVADRRRASAEVAAQHQRRCAAFVIALPPADLAEAGTAIKPPRGSILFADFQEHGTHAESGQAP